jgi:hypothetical protein
MSESGSSAPGNPEPRWLSPDERATWLSLVGVMVKLPAALDAQLQRDSGLSYFEYMVLAMLSEQPDRLMRMSELAAPSTRPCPGCRTSRNGWRSRASSPGNPIQLTAGTPMRC